jgi:hypothetical protein
MVFLLSGVGAAAALAVRPAKARRAGPYRPRNLRGKPALRTITFNDRPDALGDDQALESGSSERAGTAK